MNRPWKSTPSWRLLEKDTYFRRMRKECIVPHIPFLGYGKRSNLIPDFGEAEEVMALPTAEGQYLGGA